MVATLSNPCNSMVVKNISLSFGFIPSKDGLLALGLSNYPDIFAVRWGIYDVLLAVNVLNYFEKLDT